jgi:predicted RNA methylase
MRLLSAKWTWPSTSLARKIGPVYITFFDIDMKCINVQLQTVGVKLADKCSSAINRIQRIAFKTALAKLILWHNILIPPFSFLLNKLWDLAFIMTVLQ